MKKFLALVLTLAMILTLGVGTFTVSAAEAGAIDVAGKSTVDVEGVTYTVISDLTAVSTKGNYILSGNVEVAKDTVVTFAAGTVLHGNGYSISVEGNSAKKPINAAPFAIAAGEKVTITNVSFGTADAPICMMTKAPESATDPQGDISIFANDTAEAPAAADFVNVDFNVIMSDKLYASVAAVIAVAYGDYSFTGCNVSANILAGNLSAPDGTDLPAQYRQKVVDAEGNDVLDEDGNVIYVNNAVNYVGGFVAFAAKDGSVSFEDCTTVLGSKFTNDGVMGGFVGFTAGAVSFEGCTNNAVLENITLVTGGFVGWVEGRTLSAWTMDECVNRADITAFVGPKTSAGGGYEFAGRSAGAMVGHIDGDKYVRDTVQIVVTNSVNYGNVSGEDRLSGFLGDSNLFGFYDKVVTETPALNDDGTPQVDKDGNPVINSVTTYENVVSQPTRIENCVNYGNVSCVVKDTKSSAHVMGGFTSRPYGPMEFINCVNYGTIDGSGQADAHIGGIYGNGSAAAAQLKRMNDSYVVVENCVNYGAILNGRRLGGIAGTAEEHTKILNCVNYGWLDTGVNNAELAGGILGFGDSSSAGSGHFNIYVENCVNFGKVVAQSYGGGIVGTCRERDSVYLEIKNCLNTGYVTSTSQPSGGILGGSVSGTPEIVITGCINTGLIEGNGVNSIGQIAGAVNVGTLVLGDNLAAGTLGMVAMGVKYDGLVGYQSVDSTVAEGATGFGAIIGTATAENVSAKTADEALAAVNAILTAKQLTANVLVANGAVTHIQPSLRGAQTLLTPANGKTTVRLVAVSDRFEWEEYDKVEFTYTVNGGTATTVAGELVYNIAGTNASGVVESRTAAQLSGSAIYVTEIADVAATGTVTIEVTVKGTIGSDTYTSKTYTVTVVDGEIA